MTIMRAAGYYIFYIFNWCITLLPLRILYIFSDLIYPVFCYFPGYRKKVVENNIKNSFPSMSEQERKRIEREFYRHLVDLFIETFKLTHISKSNLKSRFVVENLQLFDRLRAEGKDIIAVLGHYGNWEWLNCFPLYTNYNCVSIYRPLQNEYFDSFMHKTRSGNGMKLASMSHVARDIIENRRNGIRSLYAFITDQTPPKADIKFWTQFLNQETPVYLGAEKIAMKFNMAVVFFNITKRSRGKYTLKPELLFEDCTGLEDHVVTEAHVRKLEELIVKKPEYWIWSHRRWKYKKEADA